MGFGVTPSQTEEARAPRDWGNYVGFKFLPNNPANALGSDQFSLGPGDTCYLLGTGEGRYWCVDPGTVGGGDATWHPCVVAAPFEWNLNGDVSSFPTEPFPGAFDGKDTVVDLALLSGPGPFDGTRIARGNGKTGLFEVTLRVPTPILATWLVDFYRVHVTTVCICRAPGARASGRSSRARSSWRSDGDAPAASVRRVARATRRARPRERRHRERDRARARSSSAAPGAGGPQGVVRRLEACRRTALGSVGEGDPAHHRDRHRGPAAAGHVTTAACA